MPGHDVPYSELRNAIDSVFRERTAVTLSELESDQPGSDERRFLNMMIAPMQTETSFPRPQRRIAMGEQAGEQRRGGKEILLVEDHTATAEMMCALLEDEGYRVLWVSTGREAIRLFSRPAAHSHNGGPDLILLDLSLPDMDSLEMVQDIVTHRNMPPIIVVSAQPRQAIEQAARSIGAKAIVRKPFEIQTLLESIEQVLA